MGCYLPCGHALLFYMWYKPWWWQISELGRFSLLGSNIFVKFFHLFEHFLTSILIVSEVSIQEFAKICDFLYWGDDDYSVSDKFKNWIEKVPRNTLACLLLSNLPITVIVGCISLTCSYISQEVIVRKRCRLHHNIEDLRQKYKFILRPRVWALTDWWFYLFSGCVWEVGHSKWYIQE